MGSGHPSQTRLTADALALVTSYTSYTMENKAQSALISDNQAQTPHRFTWLEEFTFPIIVWITSYSRYVASLFSEMRELQLRLDGSPAIAIPIFNFLGCSGIQYGELAIMLCFGYMDARTKWNTEWKVEVCDAVPQLCAESVFFL